MTAFKGGEIINFAATCKTTSNISNSPTLSNNLRTVGMHWIKKKNYLHTYSNESNEWGPCKRVTMRNVISNTSNIEAKGTKKYF